MAAGTPIATAFVRIRPTTRDFGPELGRQLRKTARSGEQAGRDLGGAFSRGFKRESAGISGHIMAISRVGPRGFGLLATGAKAAGLAIAGVGVAGAAMGLKTASAMEQARISFTTMLGSASKADVFLRQLARFAAETPFEFPELQTAASSLISAGINANKVIPIMRTLGDVTSGMGTGSEGVRRATIALQQMAAAGKITGEDLNQLRDAGIPVFDLLAAATKRSKAEVVKLAQAGKLGSKDLGQLMSALETGKGLERFSGLMEKQSHSLAGLWSTFKDNVNMSLANLVSPAIPAIKSGLAAMTSLTAAAAPRVQHAFEVVGPRIGQTFRLARREVNDFLLGFRVGLARTPVERFGGRVFTMVTALRRDLAELRAGFSFGRQSTDMQRLGERLFEVVTAVRAAKAAFAGGGGLAGAVAELSARFPALGPALRSAAQTLTNIRDTTRNLGETFRGSGQSVKVLSLAFGGTLLPTLRLVSGLLADHPALVTAVTYAYIGWRPLTAVVGGLRAALALYRGVALGVTLATAGETAATSASTATKVANRVATVAMTVASKAALVATKAWAAGQWLLNVALSANPIGLVIVAVAALAAGIIYLYRHSETFRKIVAGAFDFVAKTGKSMWNDFLKPTFAFFAQGFLTLVGAIVSGAAKAFGWVPGIGPKLRDAAKKFNKFRDDVNNALGGVRSRTVKVTATLTTGRSVTKGYGMRSGGRLPGYGGGDRVPAMLEAGEAVVPKHLVPEIADWARTRGIPGFAAGGLAVRPGLAGMPRFRADIARYNRDVDSQAAALLRQVMSAGGGGAGVERWRQVALAALAYTGSPASWIGSLLRRMRQESGGNPRAINLWDVNAQRGDPSRGLMQTIMATFLAYARELSGRGIYDPFANIVASIRYADDQYGQAPRGWDRAGGYRGGLGYVPYDNFPAVLHRGERVLTARQNAQTATAEDIGAAVASALVRVLRATPANVPMLADLVSLELLHVVDAGSRR